MLVILCALLYIGLLYLGLRGIIRKRIPWTRKRVVVGGAAVVAGALFIVAISAIAIPMIADAAGLLEEESADRVGVAGGVVFWIGLVIGLIVCASGRKVKKEYLEREEQNRWK